MPFFGVPFSRGENKFWGVSFYFRNDIDFSKISLTWLKFWMAVSILECTLMAYKFWDIVFTKIYKF